MWWKPRGAELSIRTEASSIHPIAQEVVRMDEGVKSEACNVAQPGGM
jgi:hypothetical protein